MGGAGLGACRSWLDMSDDGIEDWNTISCQGQREARYNIVELLRTANGTCIYINIKVIALFPQCLKVRRRKVEVSGENEDSTVVITFPAFRWCRRVHRWNYRADRKKKISFLFLA